MVMHARKTQRINDGYFEKHQAHPYQGSKYSSKRDYEREASSRSTNYMRDRDNSPSGANNLNNGTNSYRSDSPELDSPRESRDRDRRDRYQSSSYIQKMKDRDRDRDYKKDKYTDKRDRRDRDSDRTNHDRIETNRRSSKLCNQSSDKRSGSDDRDRGGGSGVGGGGSGGGGAGGGDRERDRDRERERDRLTRIGDWSEHVSSSCKKYYYNCKTEVSQWEKPKEWLEKERNISKEQHREFREKERDRERDDRFSRSSYVKHSSSRGNSRLRWPQDPEGPTTHRRRNDVDSQDMDISPGDSTPTSEASYSHSSTPTTALQNNEGPVLLANALPRLASHPSTPTNSQLHFSAPSCVGLNTTSSCSLASSSGNHSGGNMSQPQMSKLAAKSDSIIHTSQPTSSPLGGGTTSLNHASGTQLPAPSDLMNPNAPGPPVTLANLPKILSQITGNKTIDQTEMNPQKALQTINNALRQQQNSIGIAGDANQLGNNNTNSLRDHMLNSPLYNLSHGHMHTMSMMNHTTTSSYVSSAGVAVTQVTGLGLGISSQFSAAGLKADGSSNTTMLMNDGPPTPTQELDMAGDHRKSTNQMPWAAFQEQPTPAARASSTNIHIHLSVAGCLVDGTSSFSSLQGVVTSTQTLRSQGPSLTPSLANYFRADLIAHVTNWPAELLEKQVAQKCSDETHIYGDLQCTKVSADLKCARSFVRITEITATLQEQKVMYLRQQIRRLEELKSQNSFMSEDL